MEGRPSFSGRLSSSSSSSSAAAAQQQQQQQFDHNLSSILNNPHSSRSGDASWLSWWPSSSPSLVLPEFAPINTPKPDSPSRPDFTPYVSSISDHFSRFQDIRNHSNNEIADSTPEGGDALLACLREVPALYFKEDFQLQDGGTFRAACPFTTLPDNLLLQDRLSQYLDFVEMHLVKEISLRSNSFFQAQQQLADLTLHIVQGCDRIRLLKDTIRLLDSDLVATAKDIQEYSSMRSNLLALQHKLRLILYVNQALTALNLVPALPFLFFSLQYYDPISTCFIIPLTLPSP